MATRWGRYRTAGRPGTGARATLRDRCASRATLRGDVAQLEEHRVRIAGVRGSSPLISTTSLPTHPDMRLFLIGLMGSGKTTIGRLGLCRARRAGPTSRTTSSCARRRPSTAAAVIDAEGEAALHAAELVAFQRTLEAHNLRHRIGVAGWIVEDPDARGRLAAAGTVVWLRARP